MEEKLPEAGWCGYGAGGNDVYATVPLTKEPVLLHLMNLGLNCDTDLAPRDCQGVPPL